MQVWLIHPNDINASGASTGPRAEYLSTLTKHAGAVNVVRWSPNGRSKPLISIVRFADLICCIGKLLASAADDGMLIIWTKDDKPQTSVWGRDPKETALDKESWRVLSAIRQVDHYVQLPPGLLAGRIAYALSYISTALPAGRFTTLHGHLQENTSSPAARTTPRASSPSRMPLAFAKSPIIPTTSRASHGIR